MKTVCIVQARMGSRRLPGKVLLPLNGHTVLAEVLTRCRKIPGVDDVICATPNIECSVVARNYGFYTFLGSENDVLGRYFNAATAFKADIIVRITADCPLISPDLCGDVLSALVGNDYASNVHPRTFPQGYDCEAFTMDLLSRANEFASGEDREHVTPWMVRNAAKRANVQAKWKLEGRLTLDTEDDYKVICAAFGHAPYRHLHAA